MRCKLECVEGSYGSMRGVMEVGEINAAGCSNCVGEMRRSLQMDSA